MPCSVFTKFSFKAVDIAKIDQKENLCNTRITHFMASAKQIKARKLFALRSKRGDFRKGKKSSSGFKQISKADFDKSRSKSAKSTLARMSKAGGNLLYGKTPEYHRKKLRELGYTERTINKFLRSHGKL